MTLSKIGFPEDKPFVPHVTLGRIKYLEKSEALLLRKMLEEVRFNCEDIISRIDLMRSQLTPQGAIYTIIKSFQLK